MDKNDMFVIIYQVLKYMYECLKSGEKKLVVLPSTKSAEFIG